MDQTTISIWSYGFIIGLEFIVLFALNRFGSLVMTCDSAIKWGEQQDSWPHANDFIQSIQVIRSSLSLPVIGTIVAAIINIIVLYMLITDSGINLFTQIAAVFFNTGMIINIIGATRYRNRIIKTMDEVESTKAAQNVFDILLEEIERLDKDSSDDENQN